MQSLLEASGPGSTPIVTCLSSIVCSPIVSQSTLYKSSSPTDSYYSVKDTGCPEHPYQGWQCLRTVVIWIWVCHNVSVSPVSWCHGIYRRERKKMFHHIYICAVLESFHMVKICCDENLILLQFRRLNMLSTTYWTSWNLNQVTSIRRCVWHWWRSGQP